LSQNVASLTQEQEESIIIAAVHDAFNQTDREFVEVARSCGLQDGSTAIMELLVHGFEAPMTHSSVPGCKGGVAKLYVANCGDCRAILVSGHRVKRLSEDPKPGCPKKRICTKKQVFGGGRTFGDLELKNQCAVTAEPEIVVHTLEQDDWAVVLGCHGVWEVLTDQDVAGIELNVMSFCGQGPVKAAKEVAAQAQASGSMDNVMVLVMKLGWAQPPERFFFQDCAAVCAWNA